MPKNPIFEFFRQEGAVPRDTGSDIPVVGERASPKPENRRIDFVAPFTYRAGNLRDAKAVIESIHANPHPTEVFADSSLFAPSRLDLVRHLLITTPVKVLPAVRAELGDLENGRSSQLRDLLFPENQLNPRVELLGYGDFREYAYVSSRYANLLHVRKRLLEEPLRKYRERHGADARGNARSKLIRELQNRGISWRTARLSNKGDERRRYTDEILSVLGVLRPILTGKDCFILTGDRDVFDQVYQFTVILHDDYGSYLIANDYRKNPLQYPHTHPWSTQFMQPGAVAIGRAREPDSLLPQLFSTAAVWVVDVGSFDYFVWVTLQEIRQALDFQEHARDGRVADGGNGRNVHISLGDDSCKGSPMHFAVGQDVFVVESASTVGTIRLSRFDVLRATTDRPLYQDWRGAR